MSENITNNGNEIADSKHKAVQRMLERLSETISPAEIENADISELGPEARRIAANLSDDSVSPSVVSGLVRLSDFCFITLIGILLYAIYVYPQDAAQRPTLSMLDTVEFLYFGISVAGGVFGVLFIQAVDGYAMQSLQKVFLQLGRVIAAWTLVFALFAILAFFFKQGETFSRVWFGAWFLCGGIALAVSRIFISRIVHKLYQEGRLQRRVILVGGGERAAELIRSLESQPDQDLQICGIFDDRGNDRAPANTLGYPKLGRFADLLIFGRICKIDMLIVTFPLTAEGRVAEMLKDLWVLPVDIRLSAHGNKLNFRPRSYSYVGAVPFLDLIDKPIADWDYMKKRVFDLFFASLGVVLLSPVMLLTALAVRLDSSGPILFKQQRYGFNNEKVSVYKFRSMYHNMADPLAKKVVSRHDPRVTRVGRIIRKTTLDELPQLFNVLRGELSLVGPRPHAVHAHTEDSPWESVVDGYFARHRVKPGITGWAQINGLRGEITSKEMIRARVEHDLHYIENWSVWYDLYIMLITPLKVLDTRNSY